MTFADTLAEYQAEGIKIKLKGYTGLVDGFKSTEGSGGWIRIDDEGNMVTVEFASSDEVSKA